MNEMLYTNRSNAARAARKALAKGEAPGSQFTIDRVGGDAFAIKWLTGHCPEPEPEPFSESAHKEDRRNEALVADNPFPDGSKVLARHGKSGYFPATILYRPESDGRAYWRVEFDVRQLGTGLLQEPDLQVITEERWAALVDESAGAAQAKASKKSVNDQAYQPAPQVEANPPKPRGKNAAEEAAAARGELPPRPEITSPTNQHYVPRFKKLEALAAGGDWAGVEAFAVKGKNTYAKKLIQYRDRLLVAHNAQESN